MYVCMYVCTYTTLALYCNTSSPSSIVLAILPTTLYMWVHINKFFCFLLYMYVVYGGIIVRNIYSCLFQPMTAQQTLGLLLNY